MSKQTHTISSDVRNKGAKRRMGSKSKILTAVANYLVNEPKSTVYKIVDNATFKNGKFIKNSNAS